MGRPKSTAGGRPVVVPVRLSLAEAEDLDARRGSLTRSEFLRFVLLRTKKEGVAMPPLPDFRRNTPY
jgi:hypothetical protein